MLKRPFSLYNGLKKLKNRNAITLTSIKSDQLSVQAIKMFVDLNNFFKDWISRIDIVLPNFH